MIRAAAVALSVLLPFAATAQTVPNIAQTGRTSAGAPLITKENMETALGTKADWVNLQAETARALAIESSKASTAALLAETARATAAMQVESARATAAEALKLNATGGTLTNGAMLNGTLVAPTINSSLSMTGDGSIVFVPRGSPLPGSRTSNLRRYTMNHAVQEFSDAAECDSYTHSPALGGNVCQYVFIEAQAGSGQLWARNAVVALSGDFNTSKYTAIGDEIDINNLAGDYGDFGASNSVGILLNGLGKMNTAGFYLSTGNVTGQNTGTNGTLPIWYNGYVCGANSTKGNCFRDISNSARSHVIQGSHEIGIDLSDANTSSAAITLGNGGPVQGIVGRVRLTNPASDTSYTILFSDATGHAHVGAAALGSWFSEGTIIPNLAGTYALGTADHPWADLRSNNATLANAQVAGLMAVANVNLSGLFLPTVDASFNIGSTTQRMANVYTVQINGVPPPSAGTPPSSSAACAPGQQMADASYHYDCVALNTWRRTANSAF